MRAAAAPSWWCLLLPLCCSAIPLFPQPRYITIQRTGPSSDKVDLVFLAEGYTASEARLFEEHVRHLIDQTFLGPDSAFGGYQPLFNIFAVFVPSSNSGIPHRAQHGRTAFGTHREGNTLRSILPTAGTYPLANQLCRDSTSPWRRGGDADCDFAVILANDRFYGGLGDRIAIISSSPTSGAFALRHELGHNFADSLS